jgi:hypothetical protein
MEPTNDEPLDLHFGQMDEKGKTQKVQTISTNTNSGSLKRNERKVLSRGLMAAAMNHAAQKGLLESIEQENNENFKSI